MEFLEDRRVLSALPEMLGTLATERSDNFLPSAALPPTEEPVYTIAGGQETIEIASIEQLQNIGNEPGFPLDAHYLLSQDIDASATADWNDGAGFDPIGDPDDPFTGVFDGQGYVIDNVTIDRPDRSYVGIFGVLGEDGEIRNVGVEDAVITGLYAVGALVGGLFDGAVSESYATGAVTAEWEAVGGLVGRFYEGTVSESYATGAVTGEGGVGSLVGQFLEGTVSKSYATGAVTGGWYVGGLVGDLLAGTVSESYATGAVTGDYSVGGLVGGLFGGTVSESYATGAVSDSYATGEVTGEWKVGGLVGGNYGTVSASFWDIQTSGQETSDGGTGRTTAQMTYPHESATTYHDWDFQDTWAEDVHRARNQGYPYLRALVPSVAHTILSPIHSGTIVAGDSLRFVGGEFDHPDAAYHWDFGDGRTSCERNAGLVAFPEPGQFTVTYSAAPPGDAENHLPDTRTYTVVDDTGDIADLSVVPAQPGPTPCTCPTTRI